MILGLKLGKSGRGPPQSKTLTRTLAAPDNAKRPGVRQSSGAFDNPKGIGSFSPVLAQGDYAGKSIRKISSTRKGLNHLRDERRCNPLGLTKSFLKKRIGSVCFFSVRCINPRNIIRRDDF
jgi:hypothetical protein